MNLGRQVGDTSIKTKEDWGQYLENHKKPQEVASNQVQNEQSNNTMLSEKLDLVNTNLMALHEIFSKGIPVDGTLNATLGIDKGQFVALIKSVNGGNPIPAKV